jgi:ketosteroid isomerase-like protein
MQTEIEKANEKTVRNAYHVAEMKDVPAWVACFTDDGVFTDESTNTTFKGEKQLGEIVVIFATAFPDMHRELFKVYTTGDIVVVELALRGTQSGPLRMHMPVGTLPATGKQMDAPCCDVFHMVSGKIKSFHCYPSRTVFLSQLGVLSNIEAAISRSK